MRDPFWREDWQRREQNRAAVYAGFTQPHVRAKYRRLAPFLVAMMPPAGCTTPGQIVDLCNFFGRQRTAACRAGTLSFDELLVGETDAEPPAEPTTEGAAADPRLGG